MDDSIECLHRVNIGQLLKVSHRHCATYQPYEGKPILPGRVLGEEGLGGKVGDGANAGNEGQ